MTFCWVVVLFTKKLLSARLGLDYATVKRRRCRLFTASNFSLRRLRRVAPPVSATPPFYAAPRRSSLGGCLWKLTARQPAKWWMPWRGCRRRQPEACKVDGTDAGRGWQRPARRRGVQLGGGCRRSGGWISRPQPPFSPIFLRRLKTVIIADLPFQQIIKICLFYGTNTK